MKGSRTAQRIATVIVVLMVVLSTSPWLATIQLSPVGTASAAEGDELWSASTGGFIQSSPTVANGVVYVGSFDNSLYAFDAETGNELWNASTGDVVKSSPTVANGVVYVGSDDNSLYAFDAETGNELWNASTGDFILSSPTVANGVVYVGSYDNSLYAFDAETGNELWSASTGDNIRSSPTVANGVVYVGSYDNSLYAFDAETGNELWSASTGDNIQSSPTVANGVVYVGSDDNSLYAFDAETGNELWSASTGGDVRSSPTVANGVVYVGSYDNSLYAFDAETGNELWSASTGSFIQSSPTVANGVVYVGSFDNSLYAFDAETGNELWSASTGDTVRSSPTVANGVVYVGSYDNSLYAFDTSHTKDSSGSRNRLHTLGHVGPVGASAAPSLNGTVVDQDGNPISNATVKILGVDTANLSVTADKYDERASELYDKARNYEPPAWNPDLDLVNNDSFFGGDTRVVAAHSADAWSGSLDNPDLSQPRLHFEAGEEIWLSVWDPSVNNLIQDGVDADLPGITVHNTAVTIEKLGPQGDVISTSTVKTTDAWSALLPGIAGGKTHEAAKVQLSPGYYRIHPIASEETAYTIVVGEPDEIFAGYVSDLKNQAGQLSEYADWYRQRLQNGKLYNATVTTNETGYFEVSGIPSSVTTVSVTAHKGPLDLLGESAQNVTLQDLRLLYETQNTTASVYLPDGGTKVDVPASNVSVQVREMRAEQFTNVTDYQDIWDRVEDFLKNHTYSELKSFLQDHLDNFTTTELEDIYENLTKLREQNERLQQRVSDLLNESRNWSTNATDLNTTELQTRIQTLQQAMTELRNTIASGDPTSSVGNDTVSLTFPFDTDLSPDQVAVLVHYSNGTTESIGTGSEYVSIQDNLFGGDAVRITDYPLGSGDAAVANFEVKVATPEGIGGANERVTNPTYQGEVPGLDAISFSSLHPGVGDTVTMSLIGSTETTITDLTSVTVLGPNGSPVTANITDADKVRFDAASQGVHVIEATFQTTSGKNWTLTQRLLVGQRDKPMPPGLRAVETPYGTAAVVGDGLNAGAIEVEQAGGAVTVVAQVSQTGDLPNQPIHIYAQSLDLAPDTTVTFRLVRGATEQAVSQPTEVVLHMPAMPDGRNTYYRGGKALPTGESPWATVNTSASQLRIQTYTDSSGAVELRTNANAGFIEYWTDYQLDLWEDNLPDVGLPDLSLGWISLPVLGGLGIVAHRRRGDWQ